jgi:APA family basic amino acid/polyamine antiporter
MGDIPGLIVGWGAWAATVAGVASASVLFADFLAIAWPAALPYTPGIAVALQILLYGANIMGLREGRTLQEASSFAKAALLLVFSGLAIFAIPPAAAAAMPSANTAVTLFAAVNAYKLIRGAYAGWDAPVYFSEENTQPARSIPRGIFYGLGVTAFLYLAVNASLLFPLGAHALGASKLPFADVLANTFGGATQTVVALVAMVIVFSCANANIMIAPRTMYALAKDRLLPHELAYVNKGGSPYWSYVLSGIVSIALAATGQFVLVFGLIGTLDTLTGLITNISFFVLRIREPNLPRPYKAIGYPVLPALAILVDAVLMVLFNYADTKGAIAAIAIAALCVPFAWIARRRIG